MSDKYLEVIQQYDFQIKQTNRARGGMLLDTDQGLKMIREYDGTEKRLVFQEELLGKIRDTEMIFVDQLNRTKEDTLFCKDSDGKKYIVRDHYSGRECDVKNQKDLCNAGLLLGQLHNLLGRIELKTEFDMPTGNFSSLIKEYEGYILEMKRARNYIRQKRRKQIFELKVVENYEMFMEEAIEALQKMKQCHLREERKLRHGNYNYHNLCFTPSKTVIYQTGMARYDLQMKDLYDFLRKVMEKTDWNLESGNRIISNYNVAKPITENEMRLLTAMLKFPYKYWKLVNHYYNSHKSWIPEKSIEKLERICKQNEKKNYFVECVGR